MNNIVVDQKRDIIIIEKSTGKDILNGSKLFCGCCGSILGEVSEQINFPFEYGKLHDIVKEKTYTVTRFGLTHKTCGHTMFCCWKSYSFMTLDNYIKETADERPIL